MKIRNNKFLKVLIGSSIILSLTGCRAKKHDMIYSSTHIEIEEDNEKIYIKSDNDFDKFFGLNLESNNTSNEFLINYSYATEELEGKEKMNAVIAKIIDERTVSNKIKDETTFVSNNAFYEKMHHLILPNNYCDYNSINNLLKIKPSDIFETYSNSIDINCKKMYTSDNEIIYLLTSTLTFGSIMDKYNEKENITNNIINKNDEMKVQEVYSIDNDGNAILLARKQTGLGEDNDNVKNANIGVIDNLIRPLDKTLFKCLDGTYKRSYIKEALDVYSGNDNYYSPDNKKKTFTQFIRQ